MEPRTAECSRCNEIRSPPAKRKPPPEQEAATSTTPADAPLTESPVERASSTKAPTHEWTIEDVIQFIEEADPCLGVHADLFRKHVSRKINQQK